MDIAFIHRYPECELQSLSLNSPLEGGFLKDEIWPLFQEKGTEYNTLGPVSKVSRKVCA